MVEPCRFRSVTESGQLVCSKITGSDREVSPEMCQTCPVASISCHHLRASLSKRVGGSIIVRYGNGRSEVWDGEPSGVQFRRAACAALCLPVAGPQSCTDCRMRSSATTPETHKWREPASRQAAAGL
jgi:hypothetical protein